MRRGLALTWHASFSVVAGVLFYFFVLPRWPELTGSVSHTAGTVLRVITGVVIALAAVPVLLTLLRGRRPELGTPQLALTLRTTSVVLHLAAGVLVVGTAVAEIWLSLDSAGQWLFGSYGAAAAIALLGVFAFWLSYVAELPPPPPKPLAPRETGRRARRLRRSEAEEIPDTTESPESESAEPGTDTEDAVDADVSDTAEADDSGDPAEQTDAAAAGPGADADTTGGLRNRRPSSKESTGRRRRRRRGGVALDD